MNASFELSCSCVLELMFLLAHSVLTVYLKCSVVLCFHCVVSQVFVFLTNSKHTALRSGHVLYVFSAQFLNDHLGELLKYLYIIY